MLSLAYFDKTNLSFLQSFCTAADQLANLWIDGTQGKHLGRDCGAAGICAETLQSS